MDREHDKRNAASRERMAGLVARLDDRALSQVLPNGWTVSATLAHLAFWDRSLPVRWDRFDRDGRLVEVPDDLDDLVNDSAHPFLAAVPPRVAADLALRFTEEADARTWALSEEALAAIARADAWHLVDRSDHRNAHLDEIEAALAGTSVFDAP